MINVGVVGVGSMGYNHARVYSEMNNVNLVGVNDYERDTMKNVANKLNTKALTQQDMAEKVDAVNIAVPTSQHFQTASYFLTKGIDVLVEKPIALTVEEAHALVVIAEENDCVLQVGHIERFNPAYIGLKKRLVEPTILEARRVGNVTRITDSGVVLDLMIHDIDLMLDVFEKPPTAFTGYLLSDDYADVSFEFKDGSIAHLTASRMTPRRQRSLTVHNKDNLLVADLMNKTFDIYSETTINPGRQFTYSDVIESPRLKQAEPLKAELESFIDCVETRTRPIVDGTDGLKALQIATQVRKKLK